MSKRAIPTLRCRPLLQKKHITTDLLAHNAALRKLYVWYTMFLKFAICEMASITPRLLPSHCVISTLSSRYVLTSSSKSTLYCSLTAGKEAREQLTTTARMTWGNRTFAYNDDDAEAFPTSCECAPVWQLLGGGGPASSDVEGVRYVCKSTSHCGGG